MIVLAVRTDSQDVHVSLMEASKVLGEENWQAHRELSDTLLEKIESLLVDQNCDWQAIEGIVVFKGPGSFTGLRIGVAVANTLAESLGVAIVGTGGEAWRSDGISQLVAGANERVVVPEYGGEANITQPRK